MSSKEELQGFVEFGTRIVRQSGEIALKYFRSDLNIENKSQGNRFDPVTAADTEVEEYLCREISQQYPDHSVIGEESGASGGNGIYKWLIDPIDGTRGFVAGSPMWGTLLGLTENGKALAGFMHQPFVGETFIGSSSGAFILDEKGSKQIYTSRKENLSDAVLSCTHLSMFPSGKALDSFIGIAETCRFSRFGTDCYGYALLAHGFVDVVVEAGLKPYDIMPLIPIVEAAGGIVTNWQGESVEQGGDVIAAANTELHEQALKILSR